MAIIVAQIEPQNDIVDRFQSHKSSVIHDSVYEI